MNIGYQFLCETLRLNVPAPKRVARVAPVARVTYTDAEVLVPASVAGTRTDLLGHLLFALKHEGANLQILSAAMPAIAPQDLVNLIRQSPNSAYGRKCGFLWEWSTGGALEGLPDIGGAVAPLFDPERYLTGPDVRSPKWRVSFNGVGTPKYCATIERSPRIESLLALDTLKRASEFSQSVPSELIERALGWAYLHETQSSFAIERESPSDSKARRFVRALERAHLAEPLSESMLTDLQNDVVSNPYDQAFAVRSEQNWLSNGLRGVAGVSYIPPPPPLAAELLEELLRFANQHHADVDPIALATSLSFGFVNIHPFMDGNGRVSRFLFHKALCMSGAIPTGMLLPVSVAIARHEKKYLETLQRYSATTRKYWDVSWADASDFDFSFTGNEAVYRYWDATEAMEFCLEMSEHALEVALKSELKFLRLYEAVMKEMAIDWDVRQPTLAHLTRMCLSHDGTLSKRRRDQFRGQVPDGIFEAIEAACKKHSREPDAAAPPPGKRGRVRPR